jgi:hypothetical protein
MKKLTMLAGVALVALASVSVAAQAPGKQPKATHSKAIRISGKVSEDGARLVQDTTEKVWLVTNPEVLKGFEGAQAVVRARRAVDTNTIQVLSIQRPARYTANWSDSAFRR